MRQIVPGEQLGGACAVGREDDCLLIGRKRARQEIGRVVDRAMAGKLVNSSPGLIVFKDRVFGRRGRTFACLHENAVKGRSPMPISS